MAATANRLAPATASTDCTVALERGTVTGWGADARGTLPGRNTIAGVRVVLSGVRGTWSSRACLAVSAAAAASDAAHNLAASGSLICAPQLTQLRSRRASTPQ